MTLVEYQEKALSTRIYPQDMKIVYPALGLSGECGEVCDKIKKVFRDNNGEFTEEKKQEILKELGDVLWYMANMAYDLGSSIAEVARMNTQKTLTRKANNTIHGNGDNR